MRCVSVVSSRHRAGGRGVARFRSMAVSWLCNARDRAFFLLKPPGRSAYTAIGRLTISPITQIILSARISFRLTRASVFSRLRGRSFLPFLGLFGIQRANRERHDFRHGPFDLDGSFRRVDFALEVTIDHFAFHEDQ